MNKALKVFAFFAVLSLVLTACGGNNATATEVPTEAIVSPTKAPTVMPTEVPTAVPTEMPTQAAPTVSALKGVEGAYTVSGTNPDGSTYEGTLDVAASGDAYTWSWNNAEYKGVGLKQDDVVSVGWGGDECYVVSYVIGDDGVLTGKWTDMSISGVGSDIATPTENKAAGLEGLYNAAGKNPDGSEYGCSLQVTKKGEVYEWYWFSCGEYTGVGIQDGNVVSVAYGSENCSAISYHIEDNGTLKGTWAYVGQSDLGTEVDTPK
jgi:hypothetical protein